MTNVAKKSFFGVFLIIIELADVIRKNNENSACTK